MNAVVVVHNSCLLPHNSQGRLPPPFLLSSTNQTLTYWQNILDTGYSTTEVINHVLAFAGSKKGPISLDQNTILTSMWGK